MDITIIFVVIDVLIMVFSLFLYSPVILDTRDTKYLKRRLVFVTFYRVRCRTVVYGMLDFDTF